MTIVPCFARSAFPVTFTGATGSPRLYCWYQILPSRKTSTSQPFTEGIDHRDADAVQAAGDLVGILVELAAGMKDRHDHFEGGAFLLLVEVGRDAATVVD